MAVGIYGYAETNYFLFDVIENMKIDYPNRIWAIIEQEITNINSSDDTDNTKRTIKPDISKKKQKKTSSDASAVFSLLEILQLIFL